MFEIHKADEASAARVGTWKVKSGHKLDTPGMLAYTSTGAIPYLMPDIRDDSPTFEGAVLNVQDMLDLEQAKLAVGKDLNSFLNLPRIFTILSPRNPLEFMLPARSKSNMTVLTRRGKRNVAMAELGRLTKRVGADVTIAPFNEEAVMDTSSSTALRKDVDATLAHLDTMLQHLVDEDCAPSMVGVITGGSDSDLRKLSATETCKRSIAGLLIAGIGHGESEETRNNILATVVREVPSELPRMCFGLDKPLEILSAVQQGLDLFVPTYPFFATNYGYAFVFSVDSGSEQHMASNGSHLFKRKRSSDSELAEVESGPGDGVKINLRDRIFARDTRPISKRCGCYSCKHFSRSYIHHLLNAQETTASVLLYCHNIVHYDSFFKAIRFHLLRGSLSDFEAQFRKTYGM